MIFWSVFKEILKVSLISLEEVVAIWQPDLSAVESCASLEFVVHVGLALRDEGAVLRAIVHTHVLVLAVLG